VTGSFSSPLVHRPPPPVVSLSRVIRLLLQAPSPYDRVTSFFLNASNHVSDKQATDLQVLKDQRFMVDEPRWLVRVWLSRLALIRPANWGFGHLVCGARDWCLYPVLNDLAVILCVSCYKWAAL
jgi:hypothetical protein